MTKTFANRSAVNVFSPGIRNSPHFAFHGALHQIREIEQLRDYAKIDKDIIVEMLKEIRCSWNMEDNYHGADKIISKYYEKYDND